MKWITIPKLSELIGYTENAIRCKMRKGIWLQNTHWKKAPDGRIFFNPKAINEWIEGA